MNNLELVGSAKIKSLENGSIAEDLSIVERFSKTQVVIGFSSEVTREGHTIPKLSVLKTEFKLDTKPKVSAFGRLPLYLAHKYEDAVGKWLNESIKQRQELFTKNFEFAQTQVIKQFDYSKQMISGATLKESLFENVKIMSENHLEVMFKTKFEGSELKEFSDKLRT